MKQLITRNVICNLAGCLAQVGIGFFVTPFLVHHLGEKAYGLWIVIGSVVGYFGLLDLGLRGSVGRQIAYHHGRNDLRRVNEDLNTALAILGFGGAFGLFIILGLAFGFFQLLHLDSDDLTTTQLALVLVGINFALLLVGNAFDAVLWAFQRFDLLNVIDVVMALVRAALTFGLIGSGGGLLTLAWLTMGTAVGACVVKAIVAFSVEPKLRLGFRYVTREAGRNLFSYSIWSFLMSIATNVVPRFIPAIIGVSLAIEQVTRYSIASRLVDYSAGFIVAGAGILTPLTARLAALGNQSHQQRVYLEGGKYCLAAALFFLIGFAFLGKPFIGLWMGPTFTSSYFPLIVIALGELLPLSQSGSTSIIMGTARHRLLAWIMMLEAVLVVFLVTMLVKPYGIVGGCLGMAIPHFVFRGAFQLAYAGRLVGTTVGEYLLRAMLPAVGAALLPAAGLAAWTGWRSPATWSEFFLTGTIFSLLYFAVCFLTFYRSGYQDRALATLEPTLGCLAQAEVVPDCQFIAAGNPGGLVNAAETILNA